MVNVLCGANLVVFVTLLLCIDVKNNNKVVREIAIR